MSYWQSSLSNRLTRRRALTLAGAGVGSAAFLAACGGGSDDKSSSSGAKGESLLAKVDDTTSKATPGGTWAGYLSSDTPGLDPMTNPASTVPPLANFALSRLLKYKSGTRQDRPTGIIGRRGHELGDRPGRPHRHIQAAPRHEVRLATANKRQGADGRRRAV